MTSIDMIMVIELQEAQLNKLQHLGLLLEHGFHLQLHLQLPRRVVVVVVRALREPRTLCAVFVRYGWGV